MLITAKRTVPLVVVPLVVPLVETPGYPARRTVPLVEARRTVPLAPVAWFCFQPLDKKREIEYYK